MICSYALLVEELFHTSMHAICLFVLFVFLADVINQVIWQAAKNADNEKQRKRDGKQE